MDKQDLFLRIPVMNAAGILGLAPNLRADIDYTRLGAFVTNPIGFTTRSPAQDRALIDFPGGFLLHSGLPGPGFRKVVRSEAIHWARAPLPVIVHLLADAPSAMAGMVHGLEGLEGVMGIELGLFPEISLADALALLQAALGELPVICNLPGDLFLEYGEKLCAAGATALSLAAPRGTLPGVGGKLVSGRLYGPGLFPATLHVVREAAKRGIPVIGSGGIYTAGDVQAMLSAGALAVQLDGVFWRGDWEAAVSFPG